MGARDVGKPKGRLSGLRVLGIQSWDWGTSGNEQSLTGLRKGTEGSLDEAEGNLGGQGGTKGLGETEEGLSVPRGAWSGGR